MNEQEQFFLREYRLLEGGESDMATFDKVRDIVVEQLGVEADEVQIESTFIDDLGADSLDILQLLMSIEEEYGIQIPDDELAGFETVGDVVTYLESVDL
jgi:acyl carrier protein